jgi:hypothetical protein
LTTGLARLPVLAAGNCHARARRTGLLLVVMCNPVLVTPNLRLAIPVVVGNLNPAISVM